jgi:hypothetical protein
MLMVTTMAMFKAWYMNQRRAKRCPAAGYDMIEVPMLDPYNVDTDMTLSVLEEYDMTASTSLVRSCEARRPWVAPTNPQSEQEHVLANIDT